MQWVINMDLNVVKKNCEVVNREIGNPFATDTTLAVTAIRRALNDLIAALPGDVCRPRDLEQVLAIDYKLCWRIFNLIRANDLLAAANQVPKPPSIKRILQAAQKLSVPAGILRSLSEAADTFNQVVREHAGDRAAFDSMVAGVSPDDGGGQIDLIERRNAYRANVHIWGAQVDTFLSALLVRASGDALDECALSAKLGLKRFRAGARTIAYRYAHQGTSEGPREATSLVQQPLDPEAERIYGASLLPAFCTRPMPQFKKATYTEGWASYELADNTVGLRSGVDMAFGETLRNLPYTRDVDGRRLFFTSVTFNTPAGAMISDLLVHRPSLGKVSPELMVFQANPNDQSPEVARRAQQLPVREKVVALGRGIDIVSTPEIPWYAQMLQHACSTLHWDPAEFDVYRVSMQFPVLNSNVRMMVYV